ncbi:MAG TPA: MmgE/PrpD family protein [Streptosporangiaceae bacterium]
MSADLISPDEPAPNPVPSPAPGTAAGAAGESATAVLSAHAAGLSTEDIDPGTTAQARRLILDTVGVLLAASQDDAIRLLANSPLVTGLSGSDGSAGPDGPGGGATIIGHRRRTSAEQAAFINGVAGHHIELDDSHSPTQSHPGSVLVPAALAAAELRPGATGADVLAAIVAGYDVIGRFTDAANVASIYDRGFHPSSVSGSIGAAATAGRVLGLDATQMRIAIGFGASQSCGLLTWEDDPTHASKSFQTGVAARNGLQAALVAAAGYPGALDALSGRYNAVRAFGGGTTDLSRLTDGLGTRFSINETELKRYSSCRQTHAAIDALLDIVQNEHIDPGDIRSVSVELARSSPRWVDGNPLWTHNIQFVMALAAFEGAVLPHHFTAKWTQNEAVLDLASRISVTGNDELEAAFPAAKGAIVRVTTAADLTERSVPLPLGHPRNPMSDEQIEDKFSRLAGSVLAADPLRALRTALAGIERLPDLRGVLALLSGQAGGDA